MRYDEDEMGRLLRAALDDEANRHQPAGDGLVKIRERVRARRRWAYWTKPTLALAGAAAVVAALIAAPTDLTSGDNDRPGLVDAAVPGQQVPLSPSAVTESGATTAASPTPPTPSATSSDPWGTPIAGDATLPDRIAVWPYPSRRIGHDRADADVASGRYPNLADAAQTAVDFVASYVGTRQGLSATRLAKADPGIQMLVQRRDATGKVVPISNVFLVRVRKADDSPYVVLNASRIGLADSLDIQPPRLSGAKPFTVTGKLRRTTGAAGTTVRVALREPGSTHDLGLGTATVADDPGGQQTWSVDLAPFGELTSSGVVAAWTFDPDGNVQEFVAVPITP
jgi:hypothetical protein